MSDDPGCDRCDVVTGPALPSDYPSHCMSLDCVCATSLRSDGRAPRCYSSLRHLGRPETPTATPLPAPTVGQTSRLCPLGQRVGSPTSGSAHTRPATVQPLAVPCPYDTAVGAQRVFLHQSEPCLPPYALSALWPCASDAPSNSVGVPASTDRRGTHR